MISKPLIVAYAVFIERRAPSAPSGRAGSRRNANPLVREPTGDRFLQCQRSRLSGQAVGDQPGAEYGLFLIAKFAHRQVGDHHAAVPTPRAAGEVIAFEDFSRNADLTGEVHDNGGCISASTSGKRACSRQKASWHIRPSFACSPWSTVSLRSSAESVQRAASSSVDHSRFIGMPLT